MLNQIRRSSLSIFLTAVFAFLLASSAHAEVFLPVIQSDLSQVSCQVRRVTRDLITSQIYDEAHGSGTFINSRLFLTAGHVVTGFFYPFHHHEFLKTYIACPGARNVVVKSWIFHPKFFNPAVLNSENRGSSLHNRRSISEYFRDGKRS